MFVIWSQGLVYNRWRKFDCKKRIKWSYRSPPFFFFFLLSFHPLPSHRMSIDYLSPFRETWNKCLPTRTLWHSLVITSQHFDVQVTIETWCDRSPLAGTPVSDLLMRIVVETYLLLYQTPFLYMFEDRFSFVKPFTLRSSFLRITFSFLFLRTPSPVTYLGAPNHVSHI